jgi:hypothetical protein
VAEYGEEEETGTGLGPEKEDAGGAADLVVGEDVAKLLWDVADAFDDGV